MADIGSKVIDLEEIPLPSTAEETLHQAAVRGQDLNLEHPALPAAQKPKASKKKSSKILPKQAKPTINLKHPVPIKKEPEDYNI
jgi:hypothetical protein